MAANKPNAIQKVKRSVAKDAQVLRTSLPGDPKCCVQADLWHAPVVRVETLAHMNIWISLSVTDQKITRPLLSEKGADKKAVLISLSHRLSKRWDVCASFKYKTEALFPNLHM